MKKEKRIDVKLFRIEGDLVPFVEVSYLDKQNKNSKGLFLIDSASTDNFLSKEIVDKAVEIRKIEGKKTNIQTIANEVISAENVNFSFCIGEHPLQDVFCIVTKAFPARVVGEEVLGILGLKFLRTYGMVLDYSNFTLHTSCLDQASFNPAECEYFFLFLLGLDYYGLPVVCLKQNGKEIVTLIDTGATNNIIAEKTVTENNFICTRLQEKEIINGISGSFEAENAIIRFNLMSLTAEESTEIEKRGRFSISPHYIYQPSQDECKSAGEQLPPIEGLLAAPFIAENRWVMDFKAGIVYKNKCGKA